jgi:hypothetical protein
MSRYRSIDGVNDHERFYVQLAFAPKEERDIFFNRIRSYYRRFALHSDQFLVQSDNFDTVVPETQDNTTKFNIEEANAQKENIANWTDGDGIEHFNLPPGEQLKAYLSKPVRLRVDSWNATGVINDTIWSYNNAFSIVSAVPAWLDKIRGFQGIRGTLCFRIALNTGPFNAGRLRLAYYPCGEQNLRAVTVHTSNAIPFSQLPGVNIDASETSVVFKIPYKAPTHYYSIIETSYSWGSIFLKIVAPFRTGAANAQSVNVTTWAWIEDLEVFGQTNGNIVTQAGDFNKKIPSEVESKPISGFFSNTNKALGSLAQIPLLRPWLGTPMWLTSALAGTAEAFGYSKPNKAMIFNRNAIGCTQNMANSTGERVGNSLALLDDAKLAPIDDLSINQCDEMSLNFIKSQWSYFTTFTYTTTNAQDDLLYEIFPCPNTFYRSISTTENYLTPVCFAGSMFTLYRGDFEVCLHFSKTQYHRGQIHITWQPGPSIDANMAASTYLYREVIDLDGADTYKFSLPYVNNWEYLPTDIASGRLQIHVVNPLQAPATVANTVDCLVYVRGHESLQFSRVAVTTPTVMMTQSIEFNDVNKIIDLGSIGNSKANKFNPGSSMRAGSELVYSLGQVLKRHQPNRFDVTGITNPTVYISPYIMSGSLVGSVVTDFFATRFGYLCSPFAFYRGGMEFGILEQTSGSFTQMVGLQFLGNYATTSTQLVENVDLDAVTYCNNINGATLVEMPYYNTARASMVRFQDRIFEATSFDTPRGVAVFSKTSTTRLTKAVGDDFQLMFFIGIPRTSFATL